MAIYGSNGSGWQPVASGDLKASNGSEWKTVKKAYRSTGSGWDEIYTGSDQVTYYFLATQARGARGTTWSAASTLGGERPKQGRYSTNRPWFGVLRFDNATSYSALDSDGDSRTNMTLSAALAERTVIKSATVKLRRWDTAHGFYGGSPYPGGFGEVYIGEYNASITATNPSPTSTSFGDFANKTYAGRSVAGGALPLGGIAEIDLDSDGHLSDLVNHAKSNPLCVANTNNNGTSGDGLNRYTYSQDSDYFIYNDHNDTVGVFPVGPQLVVTLDYS